MPKKESQVRKSFELFFISLRQNPLHSEACGKYFTELFPKKNVGSNILILHKTKKTFSLFLHILWT